MKKFSVTLLISTVLISCSTKEEAPSLPTWQKGDGSAFYTTFITETFPHYVIHSTPKCPEIKDGYLVDHFTNVLDYEYFCQICMDSTLIEIRKDNTPFKYRFGGYPNYGEEVVIGDMPYLKHHSSPDCPEIKNGVEYGMYRVKQELNIFCHKCVTGDMMLKYIKETFPSDKKK